jgi:hypothetical protein
VNNFDSVTGLVNTLCFEDGGTNRVFFCRLVTEI